MPFADRSLADTFREAGDPGRIRTERLDNGSFEIVLFVAMLVCLTIIILVIFAVPRIFAPGPTPNPYAL